MKETNQTKEIKQNKKCVAYISKDGNGFEFCKHYPVFLIHLSVIVGILYDNVVVFQWKY